MSSATAKTAWFAQSVDGGQAVTGLRTAKTQALLYYLAEIGEKEPRTSLAALFWPEANQAKAGISGQGRLVVISGIGGVGKTALAAELIHGLAELTDSQAGFTCIVWRSLINAIPLNHVLDDWLQTLLKVHAEHLPEELDGVVCSVGAAAGPARAR